MIKTQHCPNCEATEQKLHDFKQKVSDALYDYFGDEHIQWGGPLSHLFIIPTPTPTPTPKPDPLVDVLLDMELSSDLEEGQHDAKYLRAKLDALGYEIREKNDDQ